MTHTPEESEWLPLVKRVVSRLYAAGMPSYVDRDDMEQECLIGIPDNLTRFEGRNGASVQSFLKLAIHRDAMNYIAKEKRRQSHTSASLTEDSLFRGAQVLGAQARATKVQAVMDRRDMESSASQKYQPNLSEVYGGAFDQARELLTPKQFDTVWCRFALGMNEKQVAEKMGTTIGAVKSFWRLAVPKLSGGLKKTLGD